MCLHICLPQPCIHLLYMPCSSSCHLGRLPFVHSQGALSQAQIISDAPSVHHSMVCSSPLSKLMLNAVAFKPTS